MNCITLKRSLSSDDDSPFTSTAKRKKEKNKLRKLPGVSLKRSQAFGDYFQDSSPAKRAKHQFQEKDIKKDQKPKVPSDFLKDLPILHDSDSTDFDEDTRAAEIVKTKIVARDNQNMFTFEQLKSICCDMMKKCEDRVKQEFERDLTQKLTEQYDTFIKFTHDQMLRESANSFSYLT
ncbi:akirin [Drosophila eugracilis]|uniref:akirin n=1 Tax=Drosophila eugracilis TaxID=29029 RepID=UPI0007E60FC4|nr:akirin [Drosophila eugracilis]